MNSRFSCALCQVTTVCLARSGEGGRDSLYAHSKTPSKNFFLSLWETVRPIWRRICKAKTTRKRRGCQRPHPVRPKLLPRPKRGRSLIRTGTIHTSTPENTGRRKALPTPPTLLPRTIHLTIHRRTIHRPRQPHHLQRTRPAAVDLPVEDTTRLEVLPFHRYKL